MNGAYEMLWVGFGFERGRDRVLNTEFLKGYESYFKSLNGIWIYKITRFAYSFRLLPYVYGTSMQQQQQQQKSKFKWIVMT